MINKALEHINNNHYRTIETFLDNDKAWIETTLNLKEQLKDKINSKDIIFKNKSNLYKKHKDFNDYVVAWRDKRINDLELQKQDKIVERVRQRG
jgi:hypothetical protein